MLKLSPATNICKDIFDIFREGWTDEPPAMYLLLWGSVLTASSQLVSPLVTFLLGLTCTITDYELNLRAEIRDMRKELASISMQDQFAVYAKTERKINKLTEKLEACTSARSVQYSKASWAFTIALHAILGLTVMVTMWSQATTPLLILPPHWTFPFSWLISLPTGVPGALGLPLWMGLNSAVWKSLPKFTIFNVKKEYRQLPLD